MATSTEKDKFFPRGHPQYVTVHSDDTMEREDVQREDFGSAWRPIDSATAQHAQHYYANKAIDDNCFLLHHLLTPMECRYLIHEAEQHVVSVDKFFEQKYRNADRALLRCPALAQELYARLLPHLRGSDYKNRIPLCFGHQGVWVPFGLNDVMKVCRYEKGGMFSVHRDGPWIPREDQASIYTVLIYLNEDFCEGLTGLFKAHADEGSSAYVGLRGRLDATYNIRSFVIPSIGSALIFNHDLFHGSTALGEYSPEPKWILRTELIMQRVHNLYVDRYAFRYEEEYLQVRHLYEDSQRALFAGRRAEFASLYQEVVRKQREAVLDCAGQMQTRCFLHPRLNSDALTTILLYLVDSELKSLMYLCRPAYYQIIQSDVWVFKYQERFPLLLTVSRDQETQQNTLFHFKSRLPLDWFTLYGQRVLQQAEFMPGALWVSPQGARIVCPTAFKCPLQAAWCSRGRGEGEDDVSPEVDFFCVKGIPGSPSSTMKPTPLPQDGSEENAQPENQREKEQQDEDGDAKASYRYVYCPNYYGPWADTVPWHMNQLDDERFQVSSFFDCTPSSASAYLNNGSYFRHRYICHPTTGQVALDVLTMRIEAAFDPVWHPMLVFGHHTWFDQRGLLSDYAKYAFTNQLFELTRTPAIRILHPALAAVASRKMRELDPLQARNHSVGDLVAVVAPVPFISDDSLVGNEKNRVAAQIDRTDEELAFRLSDIAFAPVQVPNPVDCPVRYEITVVDKRSLTAVRCHTIVVEPTTEGSKQKRSRRMAINRYAREFLAVLAKENYDFALLKAHNTLGTLDDETDDESSSPAGAHQRRTAGVSTATTTALLPVYLQLTTHPTPETDNGKPEIIHVVDTETGGKRGPPDDGEEEKDQEQIDKKEERRQRLERREEYVQLLCTNFEQHSGLGECLRYEVLPVEETLYGMAGLSNALDFRDHCVFRPVALASDLPPNCIDSSMATKVEPVPPVVIPPECESDDMEFEDCEEDEEEGGDKGNEQ